MTRSLAIVGGGPLCTYALERLAALLPESDLSDGLAISVFEASGRFGAGEVHSDTQPATSYMNRIADQIALGADESNADAPVLLPAPLRPTFLEWCAAKHRATGDPRFDLGPRDVPRRYLHGLALRDACARYAGLLRELEGVTVELRPLAVTRVTRGSGGAPFQVHAGGAAFPADHVLLLTGHSRNRPGREVAGLARRGGDGDGATGRYVAHPYPLDRNVTAAAVPPGCTVGVLGLGLTAIDVLLHLTEGRGGSFAPGAGGRLTYRPSGREPATVVGMGPSGMLPACRPDNFKTERPGLEHEGAFFTVAAVRALRRALGRPALLADGSAVRQLDFDRHLFPLVALEMAYVYYATLLGEQAGEQIRVAAGPRYREFLRRGCDSRDTGADHLLEPVQACFDAAADATIGERRFDWRSLLDPIPAETAVSGAAWRERVVELVARDLEDATEGNLRNPVKAACDGVWRDLRPVFSEAVNHGGLTAGSHRRFMAIYMRYYNRLSNGPGIEAMRKVLALLDYGLLDVSLGPAATVEALNRRPGFRATGPVTGVRRELDVVVEGRMHPFDARRDARPLYPGLLRDGLVRQWRNPGPTPDEDFVPGGLDLTPELHPIGDDGRTEARLTFIGAPAEGLLHFQTSVARPRSNSYVLNNVARWASELVRSTLPAAPIAARE